MKVPVFSEFECPLPVVRKEYDGEADDYRQITAKCGEALGLERSTWEYLQPDGPMDSCGELWKVSCGNDHVLLVPDHEGNDSFHWLAFDFERARDALLAMGCTIKEGDAR